jgi:hypothetical protein
VQRNEKYLPVYGVTTSSEQYLKLCSYGPVQENAIGSMADAAATFSGSSKIARHCERERALATPATQSNKERVHRYKQASGSVKIRQG